MQANKLIPILLGFGLLLFFNAGCKRDMALPGSSGLAFSVDTVLFDTVFASVGSTTRKFKVINPNKASIEIAEIYLGGVRFAGKSAFRLNINGVAANSATNITIAGTDSIYLFVEVTIDPNQGNAPIMAYDSVVFRTNSGTEQVYLAAVGQNAVFFNASILPCNTVFTADKPYVIYNSALVDSLCTLTIEPGARLYFGPNSSLFVRGTLLVNGALGDSVVFRGDRIDPFYRDLPGTWNGIHFLIGSTGNKINHADIRNGLVGIRVDSASVAGDTNLVIRNTQISNMVFVGIVGFTAWLELENVLLTDCGRYAMAGDLGGRYAIRHSTIANFGFNFNRSGAALVFTNANYNGAPNRLDISIINSIIWGDRDEELLIESTGSGPINLAMANSMVKTKATNLQINNNKINVNPRFVDARQNKLQVDSLSAAIGGATPIGTIFSSLQSDKSGVLRSVTAPTIGCFEFR